MIGFIFRAVIAALGLWLLPLAGSAASSSTAPALSCSRDCCFGFVNAIVRPI